MCIKQPVDTSGKEETGTKKRNKLRAVSFLESSSHARHTHNVAAGPQVEQSLLLGLFTHPHWTPESPGSGNGNFSVS